MVKYYFEFVLEYNYLYIVASSGRHNQFVHIGFPGNAMNPVEMDFKVGGYRVAAL